MALSGVELHQFLVALFLLGVGWNFLFTGSTTLSLSAYAPEEKDRAQGALNFFVFATLAVSSLASGVLVTTQGWTLLNYGSLVPVALTGAGRWLLAGAAQAQKRCVQPLPERVEHRLGIELVEDLVEQAVEAAGRDHLRAAPRRRRRGCRAGRPAGRRRHTSAGRHLPLRRARQHQRPAVGDEARQPARDAVVHERIGPVGGDHLRVVREEVGVQPVAHA